MSYSRKVQKIEKIAAVLEKLTQEDEELVLIAFNSEDSEESGFRVVAVLEMRRKPEGGVL
jgi:hypothetical protein